MERLVVAGVLVVAAVVVARVAQRRRPAPPTQSRWAVPAQLDRADFSGPERPWLVVVFTSATCERCQDAVAKARVLESAEVAVQDVSWQERRDLHERYAVEAAPTVVIADAQGVVQASFVGPPSATDLWAALAEARQPPPDPG